MTPFDLTFSRDDQQRRVRWISLREPGEQEVLDALEALELPASLAQRLVERSGVGVRRPSLRHVDGAELLSLRLLSYDDRNDAVESGEARVVYCVDAVLSVVHPPAGDRELLTQDVVEAVAPLDGPAAAGVVLGAALDRYEAVCAELETDVEEVEESVFSEARTADAERIYTLKREVAEVRRAVVPLLEAISAPAVGPTGRSGHVHVRGAHVANDAPGGAVRRRSAADVPVATPELLERLHRVAESVDTVAALLTSVFDAHVARISLQQNSDMRRISAVAALVVGPTLVAGIYGMNFRHMPELDWQYGYPMALVLMAAIVAGLSVFFKRSGWF